MLRVVAFVFGWLLVALTASPQSLPRPKTVEAGLSSDCKCVLPGMSSALLSTLIQGDPAADLAGDEFVAAFWEHSGETDARDAWLGIIAGNRKTGQWLHRRLQFHQDGKIGEWPGEVVDLYRSNGFILMTVQVAIDGGTTVMFDSTLNELGRVYSELGDLPLALPDGLMIFRKGQPHFAPTHYVELAAYDSRARKDVVIYPSRPYSRVRREFVSRMHAVYGRLGEAWCRDRNHHCDPEVFDSRMNPMVFDAKSHAIAFFVTYYENADGYEEPIVVTCDGLRALSTISCRETPRAAWSTLSPGTTDDDLLRRAASEPRRVPWR
jgi:hypothetical protein